MRTMMDPEEDYLTIVAADEQMRARDGARRKELEQAREDLRALTRARDSARASATRLPSVPSEAEHTQLLDELDTEQVTLAKLTQDAESALANKRAELARLKEEARALEEQDPAAEHELDGTVLRLQIYKGLGFEPVLARNGKLEKMLVRSSSGDIHVVKKDPTRSPADHMDLLWKLASS
ncbi:hypothetical protein OF83DRAFT_1066701 [Amylostereum chailletii]|nr:hypothetical protein OF83DRAFT_1066701 [Amylostereum chailletii]